MAGEDFELARELAQELGIELPDAEFPHHTDIGNAKWLVILFGDRLRYSWREKRWYVWDGTRWNSQQGEENVRELAKDVAHHHYKMAADLNIKAADLNGRAAAEPDAAESRKLADCALRANQLAAAYTAWAKRSEFRERVTAMIDLARSDRAITIEPEDLDRDPWLLNCRNGTIDLTAGALREHRREDLITKICPVEYDPNAGFLLWDEFLERVQPNPETRAFLQRAAGYSITGLTSEEKLFFCYGAGSTGKSTFLEALTRTLGDDYALTADFEAFVRKDRTSGHSADIARLAGARLVKSVEVDEGKKLAEALVKQITGGEQVTASHKYEASFQFSPTFHLWFAANHRPRVRADDDAMWRRILQLPFEVVIPEAERDPGVKAALSNAEVAGSAVLAWLVQGCLAWQTLGLAPPVPVRQATEEYREEMDPVKDFIDDRCVVQDGAQADNTALYSEYQKWATQSGVRHSLGRKSFTQALKARGFQQDRDDKRRYWRGLGILGNASLLDDS